MNQDLRVFLTIGFCGGYTTFSSFSWETLRLLQDGEWGRAGLYVVGSVVLGLLATVGGLMVARAIVTRG
jgi:CrcB protein